MYIFNGKRNQPMYDISFKLNYKCAEHDGSFTCNDIKSAVQSLHEKRQEGHINLRNQLVNVFNDGKKFVVTGRLKTPQSIQEKMTRRNVTDPSKFDDISGLRVITSDTNSTQEAINILKNKFKASIKPGTEDNYIENPKETGYHAYHVTIIANGEPHEVQVRTKRFNDWAETYHAVYKGEEWTKNANTIATRDYFNKMADVYQKLDEGYEPKNIPTCPDELKDLKLCLSV